MVITHVVSLTQEETELLVNAGKLIKSLKDTLENANDESTVLNEDAKELLSALSDLLN